MTRSEEELQVGTAQRERGREPLRKYAVTESVTSTVPVEREEARLEREPITDANIDQKMRGSELTESEHEVVLREVVEKQVVRKERIDDDGNDEPATEQPRRQGRRRGEVACCSWPRSGQCYAGGWYGGGGKANPAPGRPWPRTGASHPWPPATRLGITLQPDPLLAEGGADLAGLTDRLRDQPDPLVGHHPPANHRLLAAQDQLQCSGVDRGKKGKR